MPAQQRHRAPAIPCAEPSPPSRPRLAAESRGNAPIHPSFLTSSGTVYNYRSPLHSPLTVEDIAHALAHQCRYGGHAVRFYSYAQHAVLVSRLVPDEDALAALMYDGPKAVLGNVQTALKPLLPDYTDLEARVRVAIYAMVRLPAEPPASIATAALVVRATEHRDVLAPTRHDWPELRGVRPMEAVIEPLAPEAARAAFLARYAELAA